MAIIAELTDEFLADVDRVVRAYCREVHELTYIEHGSDNLVVLANKEHVFRFPRHVAGAANLRFEIALLQRIKNALKVVPTPVLEHVSGAPLYVVAKYIPGEPLDEAQIKGLSVDEQVSLGRKLARFMAELHQAISGLEVARLRQESLAGATEESWPEYFRRLFEQQPLPHPKLRSFVEEQYALWKHYTAEERERYAIHDDLHPGNLLFVGGNLSGILDFGDTNTGTVEEEMRWLYGMGDTVLTAAIEQYAELTQRHIDPQHVRMWAIMHELAVFTNKLAQQHTNDPSFIRAKKHLADWIGLPQLSS